MSETKNFNLIQGDCLEKLKDLKNESIDLIWTDPPYNINYQYNEYVDNRFDYFEWCNEWVKECHRILKLNGSLYVKMWVFNLPDFFGILKRNEFIMKNLIVWKRHSQAGYLDRFLGGYEAILFFTKSEKNKFYPDRILKRGIFTSRWDGKKEYKGRLHDLWTDVPPITCGSLRHPEGLYERRTGKKLHPTQHPTEIVKRCIISSSDENDVVLDCFMGSGTVGVACMNLNRKFIGIELNKEYFELAEKRIVEASKQTKLRLENV